MRLHNQIEMQQVVKGLFQEAAATTSSSDTYNCIAYVIEQAALNAGENDYDQHALDTGDATTCFWDSVQSILDSYEESPTYHSNATWQRAKRWLQKRLDARVVPTAKLGTKEKDLAADLAIAFSDYQRSRDDWGSWLSRPERVDQVLIATTALLSAQQRIGIELRPNKALQDTIQICKNKQEQAA